MQTIRFKKPLFLPQRSIDGRINDAASLIPGQKWSEIIDIIIMVERDSVKNQQPLIA
jgi:hypothetical protein